MINRILYFVIIVFLVSCSLTKKINDGETAFAKKQYAVAVELLEEEYEKVSSGASKGRKAYFIGKSLLQLLEYEEAKKWLNIAIKFDYGIEALSAYGRTCKLTEDYESAIAAYRKLGEYSGKNLEADRDILICRQAIEYKSKKPQYKVERIFENTSVSDYSPVIYDDQYLVFTSERKEVTGKDIYNWTGEKFSDIFVMLKSGSEIRKFDSAINTNENEGTPWFSKDMQTLYFTRCSAISGDDYCKLMTSNRIDGIWMEPEPLPFLIDKVNYGQPTLIENDSVLVFAADIEQPGGTSDLYYSELFADGTWSKPELLPSMINSQGNEKFPTGDADTLYFSSDYLPGMGGYDIFKTYLRKDRTWSAPINMTYPINSGGDDFSFVIDYTAKPNPDYEKQGFLVSSRIGSGKDDIFRFGKLKVVDPPKEIIPKDELKTVYLTIKTFTSSFNIENEPNSGIKGKIPLGETLVKIINTSNATPVIENYSDRNGFYYTEIPINQTFKIVVAKLGFLNASIDVSTNDLVFAEGLNSKTINKELILDRIFADKEITLNNIYYDFDQWDIKAEAKPTLDNLMKILLDNPQINIQLSSHTDCRGETEYNEELSQKRAQSAIDYLINRGIPSTRLIAKGYGEEQPIDDCECSICTEDQHQKNRRTTFKIIKK